MAHEMSEYLISIHIISQDYEFCACMYPVLDIHPHHFTIIIIITIIMMSIIIIVIISETLSELNK